MPQMRQYWVNGHCPEGVSTNDPQSPIDMDKDARKRKDTEYRMRWL